ncbi:MAG: hypothetical protein WC332_00845 [Clostridia bacterium]|jgi:hypothetical protein
MADSNGGNGNRFITWRAIVYGLATILFICLTGIITDTRLTVSQAQDKIEKLQTHKVDMEQYRCDIQRIEGKLDKLIDFQLNGKQK